MKQRFGASLGIVLLAVALQLPYGIQVETTREFSLAPVGLFMLFDYALLCLLLGIVLVEPNRERAEGFMFYSVLSMFALLALIFLGMFSLTRMIDFPQELGGMRGYCAEFDVDRSKLSEQTQTMLGIAVGKEGVARSKPMRVFYSDSNVTVVQSGDFRNAMQLKSEAIMGSKWCGENDALAGDRR